MSIFYKLKANEIDRLIGSYRERLAEYIIAYVAAMESGWCAGLSDPASLLAMKYPTPPLCQKRPPMNAPLSEHRKYKHLSTVDPKYDALCELLIARQWRDTLEDLVLNEVNRSPRFVKIFEKTNYVCEHDIRNALNTFDEELSGLIKSLKEPKKRESRPDQKDGSPLKVKPNSSDGSRSRTRHKIPIAEAAAKCGVAKRTMERWIAGKNTPQGFPGLSDSGVFLAWTEEHKARKAIFSEKHASGNSRKRKGGLDAIVADNGADT